jgi:hypothetical protein
MLNAYCSVFNLYYLVAAVGVIEKPKEFHRQYIEVLFVMKTQLLFILGKFVIDPTFLNFLF